MYFNTDWQFDCLKCIKEVKIMDMVSVNFKIVFLIFSNKCGWFKLEMPQCVPTKYVFLTNEFFPISFF